MKKQYYWFLLAIVVVAVTAFLASGGREHFESKGTGDGKGWYSWFYQPPPLPPVDVPVAVEPVIEEDQIVVVEPEPAKVPLVGLGLVGLGAAGVAAYLVSTKI